MSFENVSMIPTSANPYEDYNGMREPVRLVRDPGVLTVADLDRLVTARLDDARKEWAEEKRRAQSTAWEHGRVAGLDEGVRRERTRCEKAIGEVIGRRLGHVRRALRDRGPLRKTTIDAERKWAAGVGENVDGAIKQLRAIASEEGSGPLGY